MLLQRKSSKYLTSQIVNTRFFLLKMLGVKYATQITGQPWKILQQHCTTIHDSVLNLLPGPNHAEPNQTKPISKAYLILIQFFF